MKTLHDLAKLHGFTLAIDPKPYDRPDALGSTGWVRDAMAQLCKDKVIAAQVIDSSSVYAITHEMAHGIVGFDDGEKVVLIEQASILSRWVEELMKDREP
jgi:hypothetical protein